MSETDAGDDQSRFLPLMEYEAPPVGTMGRGLPLRATPLFVFLHVPKTAGTSIRQMFLWMYGEFYFAFDPATHLSDSHGITVWEAPGFFDRYLMFGGHLGYRYPIVASARRTGRRLVFTTTMRDPVARVVSFYDFVRRRPNHPMHEALKGRTLLQALEQVPGDEHWVCAQLKQIFGSHQSATIDKALATENYIIGRQDKLAAFLDAVAAISGVARMNTIPRENLLDNLRGPPMEPAAQQADFSRAIELVTEMNRPEIEFMRDRIETVLITTAYQPRFF